MNEPLIERIRELCRPLSPIPTGEQPVLHRLDGLRAVLFDVYGTLLISANGDIGTDAATFQSTAFRESLAAVDRELIGSAELGAGKLFETINVHHQRSRETGIEFPEVDIVEVWRETLNGLQLKPENELADSDLQRLAIEFECRINPVWPMPGADECLSTLRNAGLALGIVSNAQFYTPLTLAALFGRPPGDLGFDDALQFYSYQMGRAKPGTFPYEQSERILNSRRIAAAETLYVGNDMLNDVTAASRVGFRTALFAGDQRSLRKREGDARIAGVKPDVVITDWHQLSGCLPPNGGESTT